MSEWWRLPSPSRLVSSVAVELRRGRNVVLAVPEIFPPGFRTALRSLLCEDAGWRTINVEHDSVAPVDFLWENLVNDWDPSQRRTADSLARRPEVANHVTWITGVTSNSWPAWRDFLIRYSQAISGLRLSERMVACCEIPLRDIADVPLSDVCCTTVRCVGYSTNLDALIFASAAVPADGLAAEVRASVIASLAMWDAEMASALAEEPLCVVMEPFMWLRNWAERWNWLADWDDSCLALRGLSDEFGGETRVHSAILALRNDTRQIRLRVWRGQVGVLLPFIEERRRDMLDLLRLWITLPFLTSGGERIEDIADLEFGHLHSLFARDGRLCFEQRKCVDDFREIRNRLAHFEPVSAAQVIRAERYAAGPRTRAGAAFVRRS